MGCSSCSNNGVPRGCKNNGLCSASGCNKLNVVDWLSNLHLPQHADIFQGIEVRFKNARKEFFRNPNGLSLYIGDVVVVEATDGYDVGVISLTGDLVKVQMKKKHQLLQIERLPAILRKASNPDIEKWEIGRTKETEIMLETRKLSMARELDMKISDVEFQGDGKKIFFYYTSEGRVDFRELVTELASKYKAKIELRQIGMRQEASRLGGIGSCGRELCCSTWLTDFRSVSTAAARYQQLSLNPEKLAGQCGKLKCCLNYELDAYTDELKKFPSTSTKLKTHRGKAIFQKMDIFKNTMSYAYLDDPSRFIELPLEKVKQIIEINKKGEVAEDLMPASAVEKIRETTYENVVGQDSLSRFDKNKRNKKRKPGNRRKKSNDKKQ